MALKFYTSTTIGDSSVQHAGGFSDTCLQERFIHFLRSQSCQVDPYDGGAIPHKELEEFLVNVENAISMISKEDENWNFVSAQLESYYKRGIAYGLELLPPKDQALADLMRLVEIVKMAEKNKLDLFFEGD
jgi:hypothetical protein